MTPRRQPVDLRTLGYVVVGGLWDPRSSRDRLRRVQRMIPAATLHRTSVYTGCLH